MEDKVNEPSHYKGLVAEDGRALMVRLAEDSDKEGRPAQVIDVIENVCMGLPGGMATNLGNVIKYSLRCGKKAADASYQASQKDKNVEECGKIVWYARRFGTCINDITEKMFASSSATIPNLYMKEGPSVFTSATYVDICECVKANFSEKAYARLCKLWLTITEVVTSCTSEGLSSAANKMVYAAELLRSTMETE